MSEKKPPDSYREQHGCHDCWKLVALYSYDDTQLKCSFGVPEEKKAMTWAMPTVEHHGICDEWEGAA